MANPYAEDSEHKARRRHRSHIGLAEDSHRSRGVDEIVVEPEEEEPRRERVERLDGRTTTHRRTATASKMASESQTTLQSHTSRSRRKKSHHGSVEEKKHRKRRKSRPRETDHVYAKPSSRSRSSRITIIETTAAAQEEEPSESEKDVESPAAVVRSEPKKRKIRVVYLTEEEARQKDRARRASIHTREKSGKVKEDDETAHRSRAHHSRKKPVVEATSGSPPKRSHSTREHEATSRPSLKRSNTTTSHATSVKTREPSLMSTTSTATKSNFLGSFFGPAAQSHHRHHDVPPPRLVECLTCLSDDIPVHKSAKLKCGHRMCHSCLKRIFRLSVTDPQHMPPKCCTADHIPLKHVERLFDLNFKKKWNTKFQEYTTKNRIYCPARRCGEWIKPGNIHTEHGRKYGKCSRCKTKVCCLCNCKWHGSKECPKDDETNRLLETAKQAGWQRCYSCRTMVELKEGCNHMTCRCTAEFCMICGLKWKSCNCPWFNYDAVENDRLNHMRVPENAPDNGRQAEPEPREPPLRLRRPRPVNYNDEIHLRRRQERQDEALARRLQNIAMDDHDDDYQGGIGDIHGIGNGAGHFMNQDYVRAAHNILTGAFDQANVTANYVMGVNMQRGVPSVPPAVRARNLGERYPTQQRVPPPPPMARRPSLREQRPPRPVEVVVPARTRNDYASEVEVHSPVRRIPPRRPVAAAPDAPKDSVLAGLGGKGRGSNRVSAWRSHIEPGVTPAEGVLSVVD
ncbi:IBR domain-containing protein [Phlyctema vagabunda]|uniref:RBR-type E3 ubiquitin transferase n=1 Tax=Phlyctema vagabunda TaxID=108571 RepID=A0ABR4P982_9HELO